MELRELRQMRGAGVGQVNAAKIEHLEVREVRQDTQPFFGQPRARCLDDPQVRQPDITHARGFRLTPVKKITPEQNRLRKQLRTTEQVRKGGLPPLVD